MRLAPCAMLSVCLVLAALALAGCEATAFKSGSFAAGMQQFSLPPELAKLFGTKTGSPKKASLRKTAKQSAPPVPAMQPAILQAKAAVLEADDVRNVLLANSLYASGGGMEFAAIHKADGEMIGRSWSVEDTKRGDGEWRIDADGTYCRKWNNDWADGAWGCFKIVRQESKLVLKRVSGAGADGDMTLVPGNAYGL